MPTARCTERRLRNRAWRAGVRRRRGGVGTRAHRARRRTDGDFDAGGNFVERDAGRGGPRDALGVGLDARAAFGRRADRCDRAATAGGRLSTPNTLCRGRIRQLAAGDRAAMHVGRPCRGNEGRGRHSDGGHRSGGCSCRRRLFRQLPVLVGSGTTGTSLMRLLLLGGTSEARTLAAQLHPGVDVLSSLAGRVPDPALPVGEVRIGGFGGGGGPRRRVVLTAPAAGVGAPPPPPPAPPPPTPPGC